MAEKSIPIQITNLSGSEVELAGELLSERFATYRPAAIKQLNEETKLDGFRSGHIPEATLVAKLGEEKILLVMAELALQAIYPELLRENKIDALGRPAITLTKLAAGNPLGFKIKTAISPVFTLPDYRAMAANVVKNKEEIEAVSAEEIESVVSEIKKNKPQEISNEQRDEIKHHLEKEKMVRQKDKRRLQIIDSILATIKIDLPTILIETELDKMTDEMRHQIERAGLKWEDYLQHIKKTPADLRQDWRTEAEKRLKIGLVLTKIGQAEKLKTPQEEVEKEVKHLQAHYKDVSEERLRHYVSDLLSIETVWRFLENQA